MRRSFLVVLTCIVMVSTIIVGCAKTEQEPAAAPSTSELENPMAGVGVKPNGQPYEFSYTPCFMYNDWMVVTDGVIRSLLWRAGAECATYDPNLDLGRQIGIVEDLIVAETDGIIIHPVDSGGMAPVVGQAAAAGIPVFNFDHGITSPDLVSASTHDQVQMAYLAGKYLVDLAEESGDPMCIYEVWGAMGMEGSQRRHEGFQQACSESDLVTVIESPDTSWVIEKALQYVAEAFPAHPELNAIWTMGGLVDGAVEGLRLIDRAYPSGDPNHVPLVSCDEFPASMKLMSEGYCDGLSCHSPWEECDSCAKTELLYVCCGQEVPQLITFPSYWIDETNHYGPQRWGAPMTWGDMYLEGVPFDRWPILDIPEEYGVPIPTIDMK